MVEKTHVLAIDPGTTMSGVCLMDEECKPIYFGKIENSQICCATDWERKCSKFGIRPSELQIVIEMVESYASVVGKSTFETCVWIGRFLQEFEPVFGLGEYIYRHEEKMNFCGRPTGKDSQIIRALVERFADPRHGNYGKGTKNDRGFFYGFNADVWQAYSVGVTWLDKRRGWL